MELIIDSQFATNSERPKGRTTIVDTELIYCYVDVATNEGER